jgi:hypothetical protein
MIVRQAFWQKEFGMSFAKTKIEKLKIIRKRVPCGHHITLVVVAACCRYIFTLKYSLWRLASGCSDSRTAFSGIMPRIERHVSAVARLRRVRMESRHVSLVAKS